MWHGRSYGARRNRAVAAKAQRAQARAPGIYFVERHVRERGPAGSRNDMPAPPCFELLLTQALNKSRHSDSVIGVMIGTHR